MMLNLKTVLPCLVKSLHRDNRTKEQLTAEALGSRSDVIIAALGESAEMSGESSSRTSIEIQTQKNSCRIIKTGKPVIWFCLQEVWFLSRKTKPSQLF
jgi:hypothetical protein